MAVASGTKRVAGRWEHWNKLVDDLNWRPYDEDRFSQHETALTFGLGGARTADVEVRWPDGEHSTHAGLAVGEEHVLARP